jgi:RimJ/RimL family protein N-acetyltransferase
MKNDPETPEGGRATGRDLTGWTARRRPGRETLAGRYVRLEPLDPARHGDDLFAARADDPEAWRYMPDGPYPTRAAFQAWLDAKSVLEDQIYHAVVDVETGRAEGRVSFMRMDPANGVIETGAILFGPRLARSRGATEAIYLQARHVFDDLGYRRLEWKCDAENAPSRRAAPALRLRLRGDLPPAHGDQGPEPGHGLVRHARPRMAGPQGGLRGLARPGEFRRAGPAGQAARRFRVSRSLTVPGSPANWRRRAR